VGISLLNWSIFQVIHTIYVRFTSNFRFFVLPNSAPTFPPIMRSNISFYSYVLVVVIARIIYQRSKKRRKLEKRENTTASLIDNDSLRDSEDGLIIEDEDAEKREVDRMINGDVTDSIEEENEEIQS
jgi:hypothetical protein